MRILLVEDEPRLSEALTYILKKNSYGVDTAYDGETGQAMAETGAYDLIILDRMLPRKEGVALQLCRGLTPTQRETILTMDGW